MSFDSFQNGGSIDWEDDQLRDDATKVSETESDDDQITFYYIYNIFTLFYMSEMKLMCQRANRCLYK